MCVWVGGWQAGESGLRHSHEGPIRHSSQESDRGGTKQEGRDSLHTAFTPVFRGGRGQGESARPWHRVYSVGMTVLMVHPPPSSSLPPQLHNSRRRAPAQKPGHRARPPSSPLEPGLGVLLLDFFRLYGRVINMKEVRAVHMRGWRGYAWGEGLPLPAPTHRPSRGSDSSHQLPPHFPHTFQVGISATGGGHYFPKHDKDGVSWVTGGREYMLSVEDPKDATNDICRCGSVQV